MRWGQSREGTVPSVGASVNRPLQHREVILTQVIRFSLWVHQGQSPVSAGAIPGSVRENEKQEPEETEMKIIYLAGGCFWGVQNNLDQFSGVVSTEDGYANGPDAKPAYQEV